MLHTNNFKTFVSNMTFLLFQIQVYLFLNIVVIYPWSDDFSLALEYNIATRYTKQIKSKDWKQLNLEGNTSLTLSIVPENRIVIIRKCIRLNYMKLLIYNWFLTCKKRNFMWFNLILLLKFILITVSNKVFIFQDTDCLNLLKRFATSLSKAKQLKKLSSLTGKPM